jgi:hypothetical protein
VPKVVFTDFLLANKSEPVRQNTLAGKDEGEFSLPKAINALEHLTLNYSQT